ncbi:MAG: cation-transporting P-type ATPase [Dehalococcoidia bacterium]|nr:cation-transporting P-type ATPase [Dehalococcoidia bacterium]
MTCPRRDAAGVATRVPISRTAGLPGLTGEAAAARLAREGPNLIPAHRTRPAMLTLAEQYVHFFALLLWVAGLLAIVAGMPQLGAAIFVVILVNGTFAFLQEHRAERAAGKLRNLVPRRTRVLRDGEWRDTEAADLVTGDVVHLEAGDRVPADLRLAEPLGLLVDVSTMTGESVPEQPGPGARVFAGTFIVAGETTAEVTDTGPGTRLAGLVELTATARRRKTPLAAELDRLVRQIALIALGVGGAFFGLALLVGTEPSEGFLLAIGVTVALVPEGLLPTVTLSLAFGAQRMAGRKALVRHLESVETLGATTFICTDKTGTLTANEMQVVQAWTPQGAAIVRGDGYAPVATVECKPGAAAAMRELAFVAAVASEGRSVERDGRWRAEGDPMEAALFSFSLRLAAGDIEAARDTVVETFPFEAHARRMSVLLPGWLALKGAPEDVLHLCRDQELATRAGSAVESMAAAGLRVLAVARRGAPPASATREALERDLDLLGLVGLQDPPRPHVPASIAACRAAGIRLAMVTGDHPLTATAVARQIGLWTGASVCLTGAQLSDDLAELGQQVDRDGVVLARVAPEQKLMVARALKARGHILAMTGDGVNDGPALEEADVGVAMGAGGTDVAREAADLVLLDDDFATIVAAVEEGRATFENIRRFLTYHLTDNVAELTPFAIWALSAGEFPLALGVLQILCLDIGTDLLPALALGAEDADESGAPPVSGRHIVDGGVLRRAFGVLGPAEAAVEMLAFVATCWFAGWRPGEGFPGGETLLAASGAAFAAVVLGQMANAFACRSAGLPAWRSGWRGNRFLLWAVGVELLLLVFFLYVPPVADVLDHAPPTAAGAAVAVLAIPAVVVADGAYKRAQIVRATDTRPGARSPRPS